MVDNCQKALTQTWLSKPMYAHYIDVLIKLGLVSFYY
jgi:hypothetical protein